MNTFYGANAPDSIPLSGKHVNNFPKRVARSDNDEEAVAVRGGGTPARSALGINSKSQSNLLSQRFERYANQDQAAKLLKPFSKWVGNCHRFWVDKNQKIGVMFNPVREKAHFSNIFTCGSVWGCPVCAAKISEKRRIELKKGIATFKKQGGSVVLLTLTNSHHQGHALKDLLAGQRKALAYLWGDRKTKEYFKQIGKVGHIVAREVTHGENGWHPHFHILLFLNNNYSSASLAAIRDFLAVQWVNCCFKAGLPLPDLKHGLDLRDGSYAEQYVGKWGLEHEMTKGHIKKGKEGGLTPFDLLKLSKDNEKAGKLFQEYFICFKGSRQLSWSRGLKALLAIEEKTDEELAQETEKVSEQLFDFDNHLLPVLAKLKLRHEFLTAVEHNKKNDLPIISGRVEEILFEVLQFYYSS